MPHARKPPIAGLRRLLLAALVIGIAVVAAVFVVRRRGEPVAPASDSGGPGPEGEITLIGEGFEFTQTEGERTIFHIEGDSVKVRRGNVVLLEGVVLTLYDEEGRPYRIEAEEASYDRETRDAELSGSPLRLVGPDGMVLIADGLTLSNEGRVAQTRGPTELLYGDLYRATAHRAIARLHRSFFALAGEVRITRLEGEPPATLAAASVTYERAERLLRADLDAVLSRGPDRLAADRLLLVLSEDESRTELIRARGSVRGRMRLGGEDGEPGDGGEPDRSPSSMRVQGDSLTVSLDDAGSEPERVELEGLPGDPARLVVEGAGGLDDTLIGERVTARLEPGGGREIEATGSPRLIETVRGAPAGEPPLREVVAEKLEATLGRDGEVERIGAEGGVEYRAPDLGAAGDRLAYAAAEGKAELFGAPVRVESPRGELLAPHVIHEQEEGLVWAEGGARARLAEGSGVGLAGSPLASGEGPVRIESELAFWRDQPPSVLFRGGVRAWRGKSLLLADELRGDRAEGAETLTASGGVKTVWTGRAGAGGDGGGEAGPGVPVEVSARTMVYRRPLEAARGSVLYRGNVESEQGERVLSCRELEVALDQDGAAERLTCSGSVRLEDRVTGNVAQGERAVYDLALRAIDITGEPVLLTKGDGGEVEGRRVLYEVDAGRARVLSGASEAGAAPAPAETVAPPAPPGEEGGGR